MDDDDDGWTTEDAYPISSHCEPNSPGELKAVIGIEFKLIIEFQIIVLANQMARKNHKINRN